MEGDGADSIRERRGCGYYLRQRHELIRRHTETLEVHSEERTADWCLRIDFELPTSPAAHWGPANGEHFFMFPLVYLRKEDARTKFDVRDEQNQPVMLPIRSECDAISTAALAQAMNQLTPEGFPQLPIEDLEESVREIPANKPLKASMELAQLRRLTGQEDMDGRPTPGPIGAGWASAGLDEVLRMLVEHALVWVPLRGRPGERRSITVRQQIQLDRRVMWRWKFGLVKAPKHTRLHWVKARRARRLQRAKPNDVRDELLMVGSDRYCRRGRRISFSALGERIGRPLAWMPFEFEFPTIYTKRCGSYHLEVRCPPSRSPRDLQPADGTPLPEPTASPKPERQHSGRRGSFGRTTLTPRIAHHYLPGRQVVGDIWFRVSIGVGDAAFPGLWFCAAAITASLLWIFAASDPPQGSGQNEIAAGILLVVPALIAALAIGGNETPVTQLMGGSRVLLLITGLSAVAATSVLAGAEPFHMNPSMATAVCATTATAAAVPLAAGWLLASPLIWTWLRRLSTRSHEYTMLAGVMIAMVPTVILFAMWDADASFLRGAMAICLLLLAVAMSVVANNRAATPIDARRRYVAVSILSAASICLAIACVELFTVVEAGFEIDPKTGARSGGSEAGTNPWVLLPLAFALLASPWYGEALSIATSPFHPASDEVHVAPETGRALLAGHTVRELTIVRLRERLAKGENGPSLVERE